MKIFDATSLIAFLWELDYPDGLRLLSSKHRIVVPGGVISEITRDRSKAALNALLAEGVLSEQSVPELEVDEIRALHPQLGRGECEVLAVAGKSHPSEPPILVCDDRGARSTFPMFRFVWTEELLDYMWRRGLIEETRHKMLLERLANSTFYSRVRSHGYRPSDSDAVQ
jgi:predicted nucleic acid-binding protein